MPSQKQQQKNGKKIAIIILLVLLVLAGIGAGAWFFVMKDKTSGADINNGNNATFGQQGGGNITPSTPSTPQEVSGQGGWLGDIAKPQIFRIHKEPVAGSYPLAREAGEEGLYNNFVRYIERGVGHIFETNMETLQEKKISNKTRMKIYEALWGNKGSAVVIRYLDDSDNRTIRSFVIELVTDNNPTILDEEVPDDSLQKKDIGVFLPENIQNMTIAEFDDNKLFYLFEKEDTSIGIVYNITTREYSQIFQSPFTEWLAQWPTEQTITLTTKPSGMFEGYAYTLNTITGDLEKIIGGVKGLTTLANKDATKLLYSESNDQWVSLYIYDTKTRTTKKLPLPTLPEKCIWSNKEASVIFCAVPKSVDAGIYPDEWYQGVKTFSDSIWKINIDTFATEEIINIENLAGEPIDVIKPQLSDDERFLYFTNKKDMSLWGVRLVAPQTAIDTAPVPEDTQIDQGMVEEPATTTQSTSTIPSGGE